MQIRHVIKLRSAIMAMMLLGSAAFTRSVVAQNTPPPQPPVPYISQLLPPSGLPASVSLNGQGFVITVVGANFSNSSVVLWNASVGAGAGAKQVQPVARPTTFVSSSKLMATISVEDVEWPGTGWVTVLNPPSTFSNVAYFQITTLTPSVSFSRADYSAGTNPDAIAVGDFNGDGKLDLAVSDYGGNTVTILLGNGDGTFTATATYPTSAGPQSVAIGDFNGDGKLDLAIPNIQGNNVTILLGNGDGTFTAAPSPAVGAEPTGSAVGDFNGDGKLDLAITNFGSNSVSILLGNGDGTFTAGPSPGNTNAFFAPVLVVAGDFNGDGRLDLAVSNNSTNFVTILLGNGDGTFTAAATPAISAASALNQIAVGDFNGDGRLDLAVGDNTDNMNILLGNGDGTFRLGASVALHSGGGTLLGGLVAVDFNGDGKLDLVVSSVDFNYATILLGNGDGTFTATAPFATALNPDGLAVGDFNGDGRPDFAAATYNSNAISVFLQPTPSSGFAQLNGGNTFTGNQTVNGTVSAGSFVGDGSGLTNVTAAGLNCTGCVGPAQLGIPWAAGDSSGGNALNALALGGKPPGSYATTGANLFSGDQNIAGNLAATGAINSASANFTGALSGASAVLGGKLLVGSQESLDEPVPAQLSLARNLLFTNNQWQYIQNGSGAAIEMLSCCENNGGISFYTTPVGSAGAAATVNPTTERLRIMGNGTVLMGLNGTSVGIGTATPAATLEVNGTTKFDSAVTFAPGQTFPGTGSGTLTGVSAGAGLTGGGNNGNVSLSIPAAGVTNSMLANSSIAVNAGAGLAGGGAVSLGSNTTVSLAAQACPAGSAVSAHPFTCTAFPTFSANTFSGLQTMPGLTVSGLATNAVLNVTNTGTSMGGPGSSGIFANANGTGVFAFGGGLGVLGNSTSGTGVQGVSNSGAGVIGFSSSSATTMAAGVFDNSASTNGGNILLGQYQGVNKFAVDAKGDVTANGSVAIGGGTPIAEYVSTTLGVTLPVLTSGSCATFTTAALTGYTPGTSDTIALGVPSDLIALGSKVFVMWQAWETSASASPTITIQVCNPSPTRYAGGASDTIRADIFKH